MSTGFSREWEEHFARGGSNSTWPWSDLIGAVMRYARPMPGMRVLEIGPGIGANARFFFESGCDYQAIEGSDTAVETFRTLFPNHADAIVAGDFTQSLPGGPFDVIVDRSALTHNTNDAIVQTLKRVYDVLAPEGVFIGVDWFSTRHDAFAAGVEDGDAWTRSGFSGGQFATIGRVHFADEKHLRELFASFELLLLQEKVTKTCIPQAMPVVATWNIVARKPR